MSNNTEKLIKNILEKKKLNIEEKNIKKSKMQIEYFNEESKKDKNLNKILNEPLSLKFNDLIAEKQLELPKKFDNYVIKLEYLEKAFNLLKFKHKPFYFKDLKLEMKEFKMYFLL